MKNNIYIFEEEYPLKIFSIYSEFDKSHLRRGINKTQLIDFIEKNKENANKNKYIYNLILLGKYSNIQFLEMPKNSTISEKNNIALAFFKSIIANEKNHIATGPEIISNKHTAWHASILLEENEINEALDFAAKIDISFSKIVLLANLFSISHLQKNNANDPLIEEACLFKSDDVIYFSEGQQAIIENDLLSQLLQTKDHKKNIDLYLFDEIKDSHYNIDNFKQYKNNMHRFKSVYEYYYFIIKNINLATNLLQGKFAKKISFENRIKNNLRYLTLPIILIMLYLSSQLIEGYKYHSAANKIYENVIALYKEKFPNERIVNIDVQLSRKQNIPNIGDDNHLYVFSLLSSKVSVNNFEILELNYNKNSRSIILNARYIDFIILDDLKNHLNNNGYKLTEISSTQRNGRYQAQLEIKL